jgi:hypothetical protein
MELAVPALESAVRLALEHDRDQSIARIKHQGVERALGT